MRNPTKTILRMVTHGNRRLKVIEDNGTKDSTTKCVSDKARKCHRATVIDPSREKTKKVMCRRSFRVSQKTRKSKISSSFT